MEMREEQEKKVESRKSVMSGSIDDSERRARSSNAIIESNVLEGLFYPEKVI